MSYVSIQSALEQKLEAMTPGFPTAFENESFEPDVVTAYQRVFFMPNKTVDLAVTADVRKFYGLFQISLYYPGGEGRGLAQARADLIDAEFKPVQRVTAGAVTIELVESVQVSSGFQDGDRWVVPVTVVWSAYTG